MYIDQKPEVILFCAKVVYKHKLILSSSIYAQKSITSGFFTTIIDENVSYISNGTLFTHKKRTFVVGT